MWYVFQNYVSSFRKPLYDEDYAGVLIAPTLMADGNAVYNYKKYYALEKTSLSPRRRTTKNQDSCCLGGTKSSADQGLSFGDFSNLKGGIRMANDMERQLREGVKLVMLGQSATGKTTLLVRLTKGIFNSHHEATIGFEF